MSDLEVQTVAEPVPVVPGLSQWQRVSNVFTAPSKTFEDIKRGNKSWWLPFVILAVVGYILFAAITFKIGMQQVVDNQIHLDPKSEEKLAQAPPETRAMTGKISLYVTEGVFIANPHVFTLEDGSRHKRADADQLGFKHEVDPHGLLNPGKMRSFVSVRP